jgi:two-component system response regulator AtoC
MATPPSNSLQVLVLDDEAAIRQILTTMLERAGHSVEQTGTAREALARLAKGDVDVAFCDVSLPDGSGVDVLRQARTLGIDTTFIMMTAYSSLESAVDSMKAGAFDYMIKPLHNDEVLQRLVQVADLRGLRAENRVLRGLVQGQREDVCGFVSPAMQTVSRLVSRVAPTDSTVLITGESGTGKGLLARTIHRQSPRADAPFIPVNCGAIPENLLESEFFGHTKGAFTGADKARKGLFLEADRGTIFLDEIGELPLAMQVKLLHVIEDKQVRSIGSEQVRRINARIVAATNRKLPEMVAQGQFREDLYFRLSVFQIPIPSLRERRQDIAGLIKFLLARGSKRLSLSSRFEIDPEAEEMLIAYDWPGNIRELENVLDRALILADDGRITVSDLPQQISRSRVSAPAPEGVTLREQLRRFETEAIARALQEASGDRRLAAQRLGIGLSSLYRKLEENDLSATPLPPQDEARAN